MYRDDSDEKDKRHRDADKRHEGADQHRESTDELGENGRPGEQRRSRHVQGMQDAREHLGPTRQLGEAVLHEPVPDDEAQRQGPPRLAECGCGARKLEQRFHADLLRSRPAGVTGR
jgi:hypothetical protein